MTTTRGQITLITKCNFTLLHCLPFLYKQKLHKGKLVARYFSSLVVLLAAKLKYLK